MSGTGYPSPARAWYVIGVLIVAYTLAFLDRQILSLLVEPMKRDLGLSDTRISLLQGFAFAIFLALSGLPIGRLVDRRRRLTIIAIGIAVWSAATAACGLARNYSQLLLCRMTVGAGEAALTPSAYSLIGDLFPPHRLGLAIGVYSVGVYIGAGLALLIGAELIASLGEQTLVLPLVGGLRSWQLVFLVVGLPGLLVALWVATLKEPARTGSIRSLGGEAGGAVPMPVVVAYFQRNRNAFFGVNLCTAFAAMATYSMISWVPSFLIRTYGWTSTEAGRAYGLVIIGCGTLGVVAAGWLGDRAIASGVAGGRLPMMRLTLLAALPCAVLGPLARDPHTALAWIAAATLFITMTIGAGATAKQEIMPNQLRGVATAFSVLVVNLIGLGLGPTAVALASNYLLRDEQELRLSLALICGLALLLAMLLCHLSLAPYAQSRQRLAALSTEDASP